MLEQGLSPTRGVVLVPEGCSCSTFAPQKGCGYHLDLFMVAVMLGVCSVMGLPWFVAATVLSITHVNSLKVESDCSAPGEQPKFLGIREQRVTGLMIFVLMGCSVFFTSVLKVRAGWKPPGDPQESGRGCEIRASLPQEVMPRAGWEPALVTSQPFRPSLGCSSQENRTNPLIWDWPPNPL